MLDYPTMQRIARDAILGVPRQANESPEAKAWRDKCDQEAAEAKAAGIMLELPFELPDDLPGAQQDGSGQDSP